MAYSNHWVSKGKMTTPQHLLEVAGKNLKILPKINSGLCFSRLRVKKNEDWVKNWKGR